MKEMRQWQSTFSGKRDRPTKHVSIRISFPLLEGLCKQQPTCSAFKYLVDPDFQVIPDLTGGAGFRYMGTRGRNVVTANKYILTMNYI